MNDANDRAVKIYKILKKTDKSIKLEIFDEFNEELVASQIIKTLLTNILIAKYQHIDALNQPGVEYAKTQFDYIDVSI